MIDPPDPLETLARRARAESSPRVDVRAAVLRRIAERDDPITRPLAWFAAGSCAMAASAAGFAYVAVGPLIDPLGAAFQVVPVLLP
jgi:hypothetical protein